METFLGLGLSREGAPAPLAGGAGSVQGGTAKQT
jgi:hypothetical protein